MTEENPVARDITQLVLSDPYATMGYMHAHSAKGYQAGAVKALFNQASRPLPADLAGMKDDEMYKLTRFQKAGLFYDVSRKAGDNILASLRSWTYGL